jgi:hypothetical protein
MWLFNFNQQYNVSALHICVCVGNFTKTIHVCADRLWGGPQLPKVWETLL